MGWYQNNTSYQPDSSLAKMMSGGGLGGFLSNLGGAMKQTTTDMYARDDIEAKRKLEQDTLALTKQHYADTGAYYKANADNLAFTQNQKLNEQADAYNTRRSEVLAQKPNIGLPAYGEMPSDPTAQSQIKGQVNSLYNGILEEKAKKDLLSQRAFEMSKVYAGKSDSSNAPKPVFTDKGDMVHLVYKDGVPYDSGTGKSLVGVSLYGSQPKPVEPKTQTEIVTKTDGSQYKVTINPDGTKSEMLIKEPSIADKNSMTEFDAKASAYVDKAFNAMNGKWQTSMDWLAGADNSEKAPQARAMLNKMYKNGEVGGMSEDEAMREAYRRVGAPVGLLGARITDEQKAKAFSGSVINGTDPSKIDEETVKAYLTANKVPFTDEVVKVLTSDFKNQASKRGSESSFIKSFSEGKGLNKSTADRVSDSAKDAILKFADNTVGSKGLNVLPSEDSQYMSEQADKKRYSTNWSIGNEQIDIAPVLVELAKYAPTVGMNPVAFGGRFANILGNAAMFGSADAMMAELYGDDWRTAAAYGAIPMGAYGTFMKAQKALPKP